MSTFFKQIYHYTRPRAYRHNENLWPFCRITRTSTGDITQLPYKGAADTAGAADRLASPFQRRCTYHPTGPSNNEMDFAGLDMTNFHQPRFYEIDHDKLPSFLAEKFASVIVPASGWDSTLFKNRTATDF